MTRIMTAIGTLALLAGTGLTEAQAGNSFWLQQWGNGNVAGAAQAGNNNGGVFQWGSGNTATSTQNGNGNQSGTWQIGTNNNAQTNQNGNGNAAGTFQFGNNLSNTTTQNGGESELTIQLLLPAVTAHVPSPFAILAGK